MPVTKQPPRLDLAHCYAELQDAMALVLDRIPSASPSLWLQFLQDHLPKAYRAVSTAVFDSRGGFT
jgi:hypothetical protein